MEYDLVNLIQNLGVPIVMLLWFMVRTEKVIKNNTEAQYRVMEILQKCKYVNNTK